MLALWANLHGGFIMGLAALGTYACGSAACDWMHGDGIGALRLGAITVGAAAATLLTPYGIGTWIAVAHALHNPYTRIAVADWQPLFRSLAAARQQSIALAIYDALPLGLMAALAIAVAISRDIDDLPMLAISAVMGVAAILAIRNEPIAIIAIASPLAHHGTIAIERLDEGGTTGTDSIDIGRTLKEPDPAGPDCARDSYRDRIFLESADRARALSGERCRVHAIS